MERMTAATTDHLATAGSCAGCFTQITSLGLTTAHTEAGPGFVGT